MGGADPRHSGVGAVGIVNGTFNMDINEIVVRTAFDANIKAMDIHTLPSLPIGGQKLRSGCADELTPIHRQISR